MIWDRLHHAFLRLRWWWMRWWWMRRRGWGEEPGDVVVAFHAEDYMGEDGQIVEGQSIEIRGTRWIPPGERVQ